MYREEGLEEFIWDIKNVSFKEVDVVWYYFV